MASLLPPPNPRVANIEKTRNGQEINMTRLEIQTVEGTQELTKVSDDILKGKLKRRVEMMALEYICKKLSARQENGLKKKVGMVTQTGQKYYSVELALSRSFEGKGKSRCLLIF